MTSLFVNNHTGFEQNMRLELSLELKKIRVFWRLRMNQIVSNQIKENRWNENKEEISIWGQNHRWLFLND